MLPEQTNNPQPDSPLIHDQVQSLNKNPFNFLRNIFSKIKSIFSKFKQFWSNANPKQRLLVVFLFLIGLVCVGFAAVNFPKNGLPGSRNNVTDSGLKAPGGFEKLVIPQRQASFFNLQPKGNVKYGILPTQKFTLTTKSPVSTQFIQSHLKSNIGVNVNKTSDQEFEISSQGPTGLGKLVQLSLNVKDQNEGGNNFDRNYGWTYQTQGKFKVTSTIPGNKAKDVPTNTGIEFTLSQDDYQDPAPFISISPNVPYRIERHDKTIAVVPLSPLNYRSIYTVTLKGGLNLTSRNDPLGQDTTIVFQTQDEPKNTVLSFVNLQDTFVQITPKDSPILKVSAPNWSGNDKISGKLYRYNSGQAFVNDVESEDSLRNNWYTFYSQDHQIDTSNLSLDSSFDLKIQNKDELQYLQLPSALPPGLYFIKLDYNNGESTTHAWIQSTNVSGYVSIGRKQTMVWVNNLESGVPVSGAEVSVQGGGVNYTNDQGLAVFDSPSALLDSKAHYISVKKSDQEVLYLPADATTNSYDYTNDKNRATAQDYWSYLYHERNLYRIGDTVNFWGIVKNRDTGQAPSQIKISLTANYNYDYNPNPSDALQSQSVSVAGDGSFIGSFALKDLPPGYYYLNMEIGGVTIVYSGFQIKDYQKPEMKIDVSASKKAVFAGDPVDFTGKVAFYDETPVKDINLNKSNGYSGPEGTVTTDGNGQFKYTYNPAYQGNPTHLDGIVFSPAQAEQGQIEGYGSVWVYDSKLLLKTEQYQQDNKAFIKATVNKVNLDGLNNGTTTEVKGDVATNTPVTISIIKTWYERVESGTYYDFIEKVTRPSYRYEYKTQDLGNKVINTDGQGVANYTFDMEKEKSYQVTINVIDQDKHNNFQNQYFYYYDSAAYYSQGEDTTPQLILDKKDNTYSVGETVNATITSQGNTYKNTDQSRYLYIIATRGFQDFYINNNPTISFPFNQKYAPDAYVGAIIFTGTGYKPVSGACEYSYYCRYSYYSYGEYYFSGTQINYKKEDSKLDVKIAVGNAQYKPGDQANVTVTVTKKGQPVSGTEVNLALADQAMEAIGGINKPDILPELYKNVQDGILYVYYSHRPALPDVSTAERGGGGGDEARDVFKDAAFFGHLKTDGEGKAVFQFKLPDNLTTWVVFAQGMTDKMDAGQAEGSLLVTQDFFVTSEFPSVYLNRDKPQLAANSFGRGIPSKTQVSYEATFAQGDTQKQKTNQSGQSSIDTLIPFPNLGVGDYSLTLKGTAGNYSDAIKLPFKVANSKLSMVFSKSYQISSGSAQTKLVPAEYLHTQPLSLVVSDIGKGLYYYQLKNYCYVYSNRIEKMIAKINAGQIISDKFGEKSCLTDDIDVSKWQTPGGGFAQVQWGDSNLETTVWSIVVDNKNLTEDQKTRLLSYFQGLSSNNPPTAQIQQKWGLALLGQPTLNDLKALISTTTLYEDKMNLGLALATLGDIENAREIYYDILADYGYTSKPYVRIQRDSSLDANKVVKDTADALLLGSLVENTYDEGLYDYLRDFRMDATDIVIDLGQMAFVSEQIEKLPKENTKVAVTTASGTTTVDLSKGGQKLFNLTNQDASVLSVKTLSGKAEAQATYSIGSDGIGKIDKDNRLTIKRTYQKANGGGSLIPGDIVKITLVVDLKDPNSPRGGYEITDFLPSNYKYLDNPGLFGLQTSGYISQSPDLVMHATAYNSPWWKDYNVPIVYYARVTAPGEYVAEPALFQAEIDRSVFQVTPEETIKVGK